MSKELQDRLDAESAARRKAEEEREAAARRATEAQAAADAANKQLAEFAESQKKQRHDMHVSFAEARVKDGKVLPKDKDMLVATLDRLDASEPVEFAEGDTKRKVSPAQWLQDLISAGSPQVEFGERGGSDLSDTQRGAAKGKTDAEVDRAAHEYAKKHNVSYAEAVRAVVTF